MNGGQLPDEFSNFARTQLEGQLDDLPDDKQSMFLNQTVAINSGLDFVADENGDDWHYAGKGANLGQPATPVLWYQPKGSINYHVIDADLNVRSVPPEALPAVPSTPLTPQTVHPFSSERDMVEALRTWAGLNGDRFPEQFTHEASRKYSELPPSMTRATESEPSDASHGHDIAEVRKIVDRARAQANDFSAYLRTSRKAMRIDRGIMFAMQVGARYAGAGVPLGQANTPVCWYKPRGSATCRVVYADLSVRDVPPEQLPAPAGRDLRPSPRPQTSRPAGGTP